MRKCTRCHALKPEVEFDGRRLCNACRPKAAAYAKARYRGDPEKGAARQRAYRDDHPEQRAADRARQATYRAQNPGMNTRRTRAWRQRIGADAARGANAASKSRVRAKAFGLKEHHTDAEWRSLLKSFGMICAYCKTRLTLRTACRDHVIPLERGGDNTIANITPCCRPCNSAKRTRTPDEFLMYLTRKAMK